MYYCIRSTPEKRQQKNAAVDWAVSLWFAETTTRFFGVIQTLWSLEVTLFHHPPQKKVTNLQNFSGFWCHHGRRKESSAWTGHVGRHGTSVGSSFSGHFVGQWSSGHQKVSQYFSHPEKGTKKIPVAILQSYLLRFDVALENWWV